MNKDFWKGRRVFLTGHTGFKGSWLSLWLAQLDARVIGYARVPNTDPSLFELARVEAQIDQSIIGDINDLESLRAALIQAKPEVVFHLAAQPLVRASYVFPLETYQTNVMGTAHVLEICRSIPSVKVIVIVTTDKCYENKEWVWPYREHEALGGYDSYSASKACAELVAASYRRSFFDNHMVGLATARAGNVIGGGDFSDDRLIPDFIRALQNNETVQLRYPDAIRPWQHVLEPLHGYLLLAEKLWGHAQDFSQAWNFGPYSQDTKTVAEIVDALAREFKQGSWVKDEADHLHEAHYLKLDIQKAETYLEWHPILTIDEALAMIAGWYQAWAQKKDMLTFTFNQIQNFSRRCYD